MGVAFLETARLARGPEATKSSRAVASVVRLPELSIPVRVMSYKPAERLPGTDSDQALVAMVGLVVIESPSMRRLKTSPSALLN